MVYFRTETIRETNFWKMSWMLAVYFLLLFFPRCPASDENIIIQEPILITAEEGESVNITCHFDHTNSLGLYLRRKFVKDMDVLYAPGDGKKKTVSAAYKGRIEYFEQPNTITIMIQQLQKNDSGNYTCDGDVLTTNQEAKEMQGRGTILVVTAKKLTKCSSSSRMCSSSSWMQYALVVETLLLVTVLGYFIMSHVDAKKYCQKQKGRKAQNMIYEDMTYSLRRNTMTNQYEC